MSYSGRDSSFSSIPYDPIGGPSHYEPGMEPWEPGSMSYSPILDRKHPEAWEEIREIADYYSYRRETPPDELKRMAVEWTTEMNKIDAELALHRMHLIENSKAPDIMMDIETYLLLHVKPRPYYSIDQSNYYGYAWDNPRKRRVDDALLRRVLVANDVDERLECFDVNVLSDGKCILARNEVNNEVFHAICDKKEMMVYKNPIDQTVKAVYMENLKELEFD
jgi:hypothetical protein